MSKVVRENEVCFIICSNDQLYTEESIYYIAHLYVPDGYQINVLTIEDAKSMAAGYNEGMHASDASIKYICIRMSSSSIRILYRTFWMYSGRMKQSA